MLDDREKYKLAIILSNAQKISKAITLKVNCLQLNEV